MQLVVIEPDGTQRRVPLKGAEQLIGRDNALPVVLRHPKISRRHARLFLRDGRFWLEDLGSSNGVRVNGLSIRQPVAIDAQSQIEIAGFRLALVADDQEQALSARLSLLGRNGPLAGQSFALAPGQVAVGRGADNAIIIDDPSISRHHAVVIVQGGDVAVEDLQSSNGTFVNRQRVARQALHPGDDVTFGNITFTLMDRSRGLAAAPTKTRPLALTLLMVGVVTALSVVGGRALLRRAGKLQSPSVQLSGRERAYEQRIAGVLAQAQGFMKDQHWDTAAQAFAAVLELDPIHVEAHAGLAAAETNRDHSARIEAATQALAQNLPLRALARLASIAPPAFYANAAEALADKARALLAHKLQSTANGACRRGEWRECHETAAVLLLHMPKSVVAEALVQEAEDALRTRHVAFTAWDSAPPARISRLYRDSEVREAVWRYAAGDVDTALRKLARHRTRRGAAAAGTLIGAFRRARAAGDSAAATADFGRALKNWQQALRFDTNLVAEGPSTLGDELRRRAVEGLLAQGERAYERGLYADAFAAWSRGAGLDGQSPALQEALTRVEARAAALLNETPSGTAVDAAACARLRQVIAMTRNDARPHRLAQERLGRCR